MFGVEICGFKTQELAHRWLLRVQGLKFRVCSQRRGRLQPSRSIWYPEERKEAADLGR